MSDIITDPNQPDLPLGSPEPVPEATVDMVEQFEASGKFSPKPYLDPVGVPTIGFGSTWDFRPIPPCRVTMQTDPIDEPTAKTWVYKELRSAATVVAYSVHVPLTLGMIAALEDFIFNLGSGAFLASTLLRKLNAQDYTGAAEEFDKWDHAGGHELAGLLRRREAERALFVAKEPPQAVPEPVPAAPQVGWVRREAEGLLKAL